MSSSLDKIKNFTVDEVPTYTDHYSASEIIRLPIDICKQCEEGQLKALVESVMARYRDSKVAIEQSIADVAVHDPDAIAIVFNDAPSLASNALQRTLRSNALKNDYLNYLRGVSAAPNRVSPLINNAARTALTAPGGNNGS